MPAATTYTFDQSALLSAAARERERRARRRRELGVGQLTIVSESAATAAGIGADDRLAFVTRASGDRRDVKTAFCERTATIAAADLRATAQPGDRLAEGGQLVVQLQGGPDPALYCSVPRSADGQGGDYPLQCYVNTKGAAPELATAPASFDSIPRADRKFNDPTDAALAVLCMLRGVGPDGTIGPGLRASDPEVGRAVSGFEVGRRRGREWAEPGTGRLAILVDFFGGACLWVWRDLMCEATEVGGQGDDPLSDAFGEWPSDEAAMAPAKAASTPPAPAKPATPVQTAPAQALRIPEVTVADPKPLPATYTPATPALGETTMTLLSALAKAAADAKSSSYAENLLVRVHPDYSDHLEGILSEFGRLYGSCKREPLLSDLHEATDTVIDGSFYPVTEVRSLPFERGNIVVLGLRPPQASDEELYVLAGLCEPQGGGALVRRGSDAVASPDGGEERGLMQRAGSAAKGLGKKAADLAVQEGKRKAGIAVQELGGDSLLEGVETAKAGVQGLLRMFGFENAAKLAGPAIDLMSTSGARMLGAAIEGNHPGLGRTLQQIGDTVERKHGQRIAQGVREAAAPLLDAVKSSLGEAAGRALAPALQTMGALPAARDEAEGEEADEPVDDRALLDEPKPAAAEAKPAKARSRARRPAAAKAAKGDE